MIQSARAEDVRVAFYGRVACDDDPQHALQHQLDAVTAALPREIPVVGYFVDVGPWNGRHGSKYAYRVPSLDGHPIDGGLTDLLDRTRRPDRHFDIIACARADRLSRRLVDLVRIEDDLAAYGVRVVTADDPNIATPHPLETSDVAQKRLRRWAWDLVTTETAYLSSTARDQLRAQGWHLGPIPYGYTTETLTVQRRQRRRLIVDPIRALVVQTIFAYRVHHGLGIAAIARALNADPARPTAPLPGANNAPCSWTADMVRAILTNPVYTGRLVSNRIGTDRRPRPITEWPWSPTPVHEPIIALDLFLAAQPTATIRQPSADDHGHSATGEPATPQQPHKGAQR